MATCTSLFVIITPLIGSGANQTQIAAYVVSGIGFLAGGVIFKERLSVSGLNTAATLWCTAAVGALTGYGFFSEAVEERIRTAMIAAIRSAAMSLIAVYSEDLESIDRVEVTADVSVIGRPDSRLEKIVSEIGLEPGVFAVSWKSVPTSDEDRALMPEA